ncbi:Sir2 family NAD-dependent protein deacetylase [Sinomonas sp. ASV322]|uniref:Sir2 family NAD-dependent protein deacetylase n=1 Tax=Sinomonas sp. ASV322 TaxID=3041920 RepID=UPI0027DBACF2|nr:Sir2 family NAD-dependent protein deacetylase [Sinomonas sp. ASV322]MDQ4502457.1 Sir2 family NAD-dependent protein deacetylase [Sinomonas sp. ASV322]
MSEVTDRTNDPAVARAHAAALRSIAREVVESVELQDPDEARAGLLGLLRAGSVMALTGAGVSTASGIPDYRGPQGAWRKHRPMTYQEFRHDPAARHRYWARSFIGWRHIDRAQPNRAHRVLAQLEAEGAVLGVVTQNVDGLHAAAGSRNLVTLHGDLDKVVCLNCGTIEGRSNLDERLAQANPGYAEAVRLDPGTVNPDGDVELPQSWVDRFLMVGCLVCGSVELKPDVVYFGESVPLERKERATAMLAEARSLLVLGSSLAVMSGFRFVLDAVREGKRVGIVNAGPTRGDSRAEWRWRADVGEALEVLAASL